MVEKETKQSWRISEIEDVWGNDENEANVKENRALKTYVRASSICVNRIYIIKNKEKLGSFIHEGSFDSSFWNP